MLARPWGRLEREGWFLFAGVDRMELHVPLDKWHHCKPKESQDQRNEGWDANPGVSQQEVEDFFHGRTSFCLRFAGILKPLWLFLYRVMDTKYVPTSAMNTRMDFILGCWLWVE